MAKSLRGHGFAEHITLLGDEAHEPCNRPSLSKAMPVGAVVQVLPAGEAAGRERTKTCAPVATLPSGARTRNRRMPTVPW